MFSPTDSNTLESFSPTKSEAWVLTFPQILLTTVFLLILVLGFSVGYVDLSLLYLQVTLVLAPLLYFSYLKYSSRSNELTIVWWHALPYLFLFITWMAGWYAGFQNKAGNEAFSLLYIISYALAFIILVGSLIWILPRIIKEFHLERNPVGDVIVVVLVVMMMMAVISALKLSELTVDGLKDQYSISSSIYIIVLTLVFLLSRILFKLFCQTHLNAEQSNFLLDFEPNCSVEVESESQSENSELAQLARVVEDAMMKDNLYLNPSLSLDLIVEKTGVAKHILSALFNTHYQKGFYQMIGEYRIRHATRILEKNQNISLDALSEVCGFNSKTTFYKYFKSINGCTPNNYIQSLEDNGPIKRN